MRWPSVVLGLLLIGGALGYLVAPSPTELPAPVQLDPQALQASVEGRSESMPSLLGLTRDVANSVLIDAGLGDVRVEEKEKPAAGPAGVVLVQQPAAGARPTDRLDLTVSTQAPMPVTIGRPANDVRTELEQLGAVVQVIRNVDPAAPANQVLGSEPAAGQPMPVVVKLTVADPGDALALASVSAVDRTGCSTTSSATVNGRSVGDSVTCTPDVDDSAFAEYALSRNAAALEATVGTDDREGTGPATVVFIGDGRVLQSVDVGLGHTETVRIDTRDVLRLRIEASSQADDDAPTVVLGDIRLLGAPNELDAIAGNR